MEDMWLIIAKKKKNTWDSNVVPHLDMTNGHVKGYIAEFPIEWVELQLGSSSLILVPTRFLPDKLHKLYESTVD